jgi:Protein of unknown function (DUF4038)/Putative collagen-binding domain of a collagenase
MDLNENRKGRWPKLASVVVLGVAVVLFRSAHNRHASDPGKRMSRARTTVGGQFMTLNADGTYLMNSITNKPVFMTGDAPQTLMVQVDNTAVITYLADRARRGFNVLWVYPVDKTDQTNAPKNYYGNTPFNGADFTNEDATYWAHIDYVVQQAQAYGITLMMNPGFVGLDSTGGYIQSYLNSSDAVITAYGNWIGNRYRRYPNIIWSIGGDSNTLNIPGLKQKISDLATGLAAGDPNHLITSEECPVGVCGVGHNSTLDIWGGASWVGINGDYSQYGQAQSQCAAQYAMMMSYPTVPPFQIEDWYEGTHSITELQLREEAYWEVLSGCYLGRMFGNDAIWTMGGPKDSIGKTWQSQLGSRGSVDQEYLGKLMRSREHWLMVPDANNTVLTAGYDPRTLLGAIRESLRSLVRWKPRRLGSVPSVAARASDGQTILAYVPSGNATTITVDMTKISSQEHEAKCWWYSPSGGEAREIGVFANSGSRNFTPPDSNDWVLVIDDAAAELPRPGGADL